MSKLLFNSLINQGTSKVVKLAQKRIRGRDVSVSISQMNVEMNLPIDSKLATAVLCGTVLSRPVVSDSLQPHRL